MCYNALRVNSIFHVYATYDSVHAVYKSVCNTYGFFYGVYGAVRGIFKIVHGVFRIFLPPVGGGLEWATFSSEYSYFEVQYNNY